MPEMLRSHGVLATFKLFLVPVVVALPKVSSNRQDQAEHLLMPTTDDAVSTPHWDVVIEDIPVQTSPSGPGSTCNLSSHCVGALVCLASGACGCPESTPVLLLDKERYACAMQALTWRPIGTVLFPAVLLILAFLILASYGYYRLTERGGGKLEAHDNISSVLASRAATCTQRLRKWFEGWSLKRLYDGSFSRRHLPSFALSAFQIPRSILARWNWPKYDRFGQENGREKTGEENLAPIVEGTNSNFEDCSSAATTTHVIAEATLDPTEASPIRPLYPMPRSSFRVDTVYPTPVTSLQVCAEKQSQSCVPRQHTPLCMVDDRLPAPKRRTKISTLSTSTLMPCRLKQRKNFILLSTSPLTETPTARTSSSCWEENDAKISLCEARPMSTFRFTKSELSFRFPKRSMSEETPKPGIEALRRTISEGFQLLAMKAKENTACPSNSHASSMARCGKSSESLGWTTHSYSNMIGRKTSERFKDCRPLPTTFPLSAFRHGACKHVDRTLLAWNTFTMQNDSARPEDESVFMTDSVAKVAAHRRPWMQPHISTQRPPTADRNRCRRGPLTYGMASPVSMSVAPQSSTGFALSEMASDGHLRCSGEASSRRPPFLLESTAGPTDPVVSHATSLINPPQFDRASRPLGFALLSAMMRADRRVEGSYF